MADDPSTPAPRAEPVKQESVKETVISVIISFAMAFVFRSYVVEPFRIPTGSMAPTLLGAHMRFHSPLTGYDWTVNPRDYSAATRAPLKVQGWDRADRDPVSVQDPMSGLELQRENLPLRAGDRILVLKYLYLLREPERHEVVVFKNPENPNVNLIKRLIGLPNEQVLIVDGDIFVREAGAEGPYRVTRKPERVQRAVWASLYSSDYAPIPGATQGWRPPWTGAGWELEGREYRWDSAAETTLAWDASVRPINDFTPYNATLGSAHAAVARAFPVSDLRVRARVRPDSAGLTATMRIGARGVVFEATIGETAATLTATDAKTGETLLSERAEGAFLEAGAYTPIEFWHADQALWLWAGGERVLRAEYGWAPEERFRRATAPGAGAFEPADPETHARPEVSMRFSGSPVTLSGVALDRDLHYRSWRQNGRYFRATHPTYPATLGPDQFFMLGDNSAASHDGRSWSRVDPWIGARFGYDRGVVPRELILGRAFMVYWPARFSVETPLGISAPVPDVGRLRFIR